jgi:hypothetical protein
MCGGFACGCEWTYRISSNFYWNKRKIYIYIKQIYFFVVISYVRHVKRSIRVVVNIEAPGLKPILYIHCGVAVIFLYFSFSPSPHHDSLAQRVRRPVDIISWPNNAPTDSLNSIHVHACKTVSSFPPLWQSTTNIVPSPFQSSCSFIIGATGQSIFEPCTLMWCIHSDWSFSNIKSTKWSKKTIDWWFWITSERSLN